MANNTEDDNTTLAMINFNLPRSMLKKLRAYAFQNDRTLSSVCRLAIARFLGVKAPKTRGQGRPVKVL